MRIDFYEEFPTKKNLGKLKLIKFRVRLFIAAKSLERFKELEKQSEKIKKNIEIAYWPIVRNSYWISPFSNTKDLIELFTKLDTIKNQLLIDLELPMLNKKMMIKNFLSFSKNKKLIDNFLSENKKRLTVAQYPSTLVSNLMKIVGLNYDIEYEKNPMFYSSMLKRSQIKKIKQGLVKMKQKKRSCIGLGTIAVGILGNEPILSPENLEKDLEFVKKAGFDKVIIFRLGGLNKEYMKIINKFQK